MTQLRIDFECLKELIKDEPLIKLVDELPSKESAGLSYIYLLNSTENKKAYLLKPDRSEYEFIDLSPQLINVLGEGYITVDKETLNENGDVTFTVKADETLKTLLKTLEDKVKELEGKSDNDSQTLTLDGNTLTISNGNSVTLPSSASSSISTYSLGDNKSAVDSFIKGESFTGSDKNFSFPRVQLGKLEALVGADNFFLRTQYAEGVTISREVKNINPVEVAFITYEEETDSLAVLDKFLTDEDEKFKEGRIEVLDSNLYPTLLRYKDSSGKVFRVTNGLDDGSFQQILLNEEGECSFTKPILTNKVNVSSSVLLKDGEATHILVTFKSTFNFGEETIQSSRIYLQEGYSPFELICNVVYNNIPAKPVYIIDFLCKSYIDGNVYISTFKKSETKENNLESTVKVKKDGVVSDVIISVNSPFIMLGV